MRDLLMSVVPPEKGREAVSEYRTLESFPRRTHTQCLGI
jgi:hypothetical protein